MSFMARDSSHRHSFAIFNAAVHICSKDRLFATCDTANFRHSGWRKSAKECTSVFMEWNSLLKTDLACVQNPMSSPASNWTLCIWRAHRINSSMQSARLASRDSKFPIVSTTGFIVLMSCFSLGKQLGSPSTILTMSTASSSGHQCACKSLKKDH